MSEVTVTLPAPAQTASLRRHSCFSCGLTIPAGKINLSLLAYAPGQPPRRVANHLPGECEIAETDHA